MYGKKKKLDDKEWNKNPSYLKNSKLCYTCENQLWNKDETIKNTHTSINSYDLCSSK